jgi:hypothetical protein
MIIASFEKKRNSNENIWGTVFPLSLIPYFLVHFAAQDR